MNQTQSARSFRRVVRAIAPFQCSFNLQLFTINLIMDPAYVRSAVKDSAGTYFNVVPEQKFRYIFASDSVEMTAKGLEASLQKVSQGHAQVVIDINLNSTSFSMAPGGITGLNRNR